MRHRNLLCLSPMVVLLLAICASAQTGTFKILHSFTSGSDGAYPATPLALDKAGNLYGMTGAGGTGIGCSFGCGTAFELSQRNGHSWLMALEQVSSSNEKTP